MIFIKSFIIGFLIAAPVGPIGLLCIQRVISKGKPSGICTGLGAASADAVYGFIAAVGLTMISAFMINYQQLIKIIGSLFLIFLGLKIYLDSNKSKNSVDENVSSRNLVKDYLSTFFLTLTNPATILAFLAIFASLSILNKNDSLLVVAGVFLGSLLWWIILCFIADFFKQKVKLNYVNIFSAFMLIVFAISILFN